jgi:hypothetical protein
VRFTRSAGIIFAHKIDWLSPSILYRSGQKGAAQGKSGKRKPPVFSGLSDENRGLKGFNGKRLF